MEGGGPDFKAKLLELPHIASAFEVKNPKEVSNK
jgi:hypothetical protein